MQTSRVLHFLLLESMTKNILIDCNKQCQAAIYFFSFFLKKNHYILGSLPHQYNRPSDMFNVYLVFHGVSSLSIMH